MADGAPRPTRSPIIGARRPAGAGRPGLGPPGATIQAARALGHAHSLTDGPRRVIIVREPAPAAAHSHMLDWTTLLPYIFLLSGLALLLAGLSLSDYRRGEPPSAPRPAGDGRTALLGGLLVGGGLALAPAPPLWRALGLALVVGAPATWYVGAHAGARARAVALAGQFVRAEPLWLALLWPVALFPSAWLTPLLLVLPALWGARRLARGRFVPRTPLDWPLALLLLMVLVSAFVTPDLAYSLPKITGLVFGVALFYALVEWAGTDGRIRAGFAGYAGAGAALALLGLLGTEWLSKFPGVEAAAARLPQGVRGLPGAESDSSRTRWAGRCCWWRCRWWR